MKKKIQIALGALAIAAFVFAVIFVLNSEYAQLIHPKGIIARKERDLISLNYLLMLVVIIPTFIVLFYVVRKYALRKTETKYQPERSASRFEVFLIWAFPSLIIGVMSVILWFATHELDPYKPIESEKDPVHIQVVAMDWKWLFIYPDQGIATVNFLEIPAGVPISFKLAADNSPMNSFWIPQLSGQIYAMSGMITPLHLMADEPGEYMGRAAEINGRGYADMTFVVKSTTESEFEKWVQHVKQSPLRLTDSAYEELLKRATHPVALYSYVEEDLFNKIVMKYMHHGGAQ